MTIWEKRDIISYLANSEDKGGKKMEGKKAEGLLGEPAEGEIWHQFACVQTDNWQKRPKQEKIEVLLTDGHGRFAYTVQMQISDFLRIFVENQGGIFEKRVQILAVNQDRSVQYAILDTNGRTFRECTTKIEQVWRDFMPKNPQIADHAQHAQAVSS